MNAPISPFVTCCSDDASFLVDLLRSSGVKSFDDTVVGVLQSIAVGPSQLPRWLMFSAPSSAVDLVFQTKRLFPFVLQRRYLP